MKETAQIKILIVEDDPFFQRVLQKRVEGEATQRFRLMKPDEPAFTSRTTSDNATSGCIPTSIWT